jgi:hypothetical protein
MNVKSCSKKLNGHVEFVICSIVSYKSKLTKKKAEGREGGSTWLSIKKKKVNLEWKHYCHQNDHISGTLLQVHPWGTKFWMTVGLMQMIHDTVGFQWLLRHPEKAQLPWENPGNCHCLRSSSSVFWECVSNDTGGTTQVRPPQLGGDSFSATCRSSDPPASFLALVSQFSHL